MKRYHAFILIGILTFASCQSNQEKDKDDHTTHRHPETEAVVDGSKKVLSPRKQAMANIGDVHVHVDYSSPGKRGRTIWNGLVAYGQVWVTGAHSATSIEFSDDVIIQEQKVPRGKYAFFTIPNSSEWVIILNKNYEQHLTDDYDSEQDVVRVKVIPKSLEESVESLTYQIIALDEKSGAINIAWDKLEVQLPFEVE